jgi:class 3 adenylate cyclase/tetratricopeptide (TPR) repeat protein
MAGCPRCQAANPEGYRFCGNCGAALQAHVCPSCGAANPEGQPFCGQCGARLALEVAGAELEAATSSTDPAGSVRSAADEVPVEERKLATVLFADVVGFTSLAERTDPEVVARMVDGAFQELARVVAEHGGTVDKYMGDSLMAVFGVPVAHDDDAERAVAAGLAMRRLGGDLVFSIGVNSGEVMVGAVGGTGVTVIGDTVNVAARLEKAAGPGEVLCGRLTTELARHRVEFEERQPVLLKGKSEPVDVWAALHLRRTAEGPVAERPPLVGRDTERSFLEMQWRRVAADREGALVVLCGDAGSGKTRLLEELAAVAADEGRVVHAAYPAYGVVGGLQVAAELIDQLGPSSDADVEARVRSVMGELDPSLRALDAPAMAREQVWALGRLVKEKACDRPLVVLVDDLHWADDRTLELLEQLAGHLRDVPLLTVVAGRTEPSSWLARFASATTLRLRPLTRAQAECLAEALVGGVLAAESREFFADMAKGNPLYLRELVATARSRGMLVDGGEGLRLTSDRSVPASLQALLAARLDALERGQKTVFQHLAVLGEATAEELEALGERHGAAALQALSESGLVRAGADGRYEVADPLLGEVAYDMLPRTARGDLHRRAAGIVTRPDGRARHLERATAYLPDDTTLAAEAAESLAREGHVLAEAFRHLDAIGLLEKSVALGMRRPAVLLELGRLQAACGKEDESIETLALIPDDPDLPAQAIERDHTAAAGKVFTDPAWALPRLLEAAERWRALGNQDKEAWAVGNAGVAYFYMSKMHEAAHELDRALSMFEALGDAKGAQACTTLLSLARPEDPRVDTWLANALSTAAESGDRARQITALTTLTWNHFFKSMFGSADDTAEAEAFAARLSEVAEELGAFDMAVHGRSLKALMARFTGRFDEARAEIEALARTGTLERRHNESWLAWAASFALTLATSSPEAAAPFLPQRSTDPVVAMASIMVETALVLAGRHDEAAERVLRDPPTLEGPMADAGGMLAALALTLDGKGDTAVPLLQRAATGAGVLGATHLHRAAMAMLAALEGRSPDIEVAGNGPSLADAVVLRARALHGDRDALGRLTELAGTLVAPGLLPDLP